MKTGMKEVEGTNGMVAVGLNHHMQVTDIAPDIGTILIADTHGNRDIGTSKYRHDNKKENAKQAFSFFMIIIFLF